jgi:hypothetical protein
VVISDFDEFLIAYDEAVPGQFKDVDLLAYEAGKLSGCLSLAFVSV